MSNTAPQSGLDWYWLVCDESKATGKPFHLLQALALHCGNKEGTCFPGLRTLAREIRVRWNSNVIRNLHVLYGDTLKGLEVPELERRRTKKSYEYRLLVGPNALNGKGEDNGACPHTVMYTFGEDEEGGKRDDGMYRYHCNRCDMEEDRPVIECDEHLPISRKDTDGTPWGQCSRCLRCTDH